MTSMNARLVSSGAPSTAAAAPMPSLTNATNAPSRRDGGPVTTSSYRCSSAQHTCFYFTVFFSNNPPIFHSNRIPADLLGISSTAPSTFSATDGGDGSPNTLTSNTAGGGSCEGAAGPSSSSPTSSAGAMCATCQQRRWQHIFSDPNDRRGVGKGASPAAWTGHCTCAANATTTKASTSPAGCREHPWSADAAMVGDFRCAAAALDEVPQQTLQTVAFPTAFGSCGGSVGSGGACPLPVRKLGPRKRHAPVLTSTTLSSHSPTSGTAAAAAAVPAVTPAHIPAAERTTVGHSTEDLSKANNMRDSSAAPAATAKTALSASGKELASSHSFACDTPLKAANAATQPSSGLRWSNSAAASGNFNSAIFCISPNTLPLTTTVSSDTTTTTATTAAAAGNGVLGDATTDTAGATSVQNSSSAARAGCATADNTTNASVVVPARFKPTFPVVKWEEEEDEEDVNDGKRGQDDDREKEGDALRARSIPAAPASTAGPSSSSENSETAVAAAAAPAPAPVRATALSRRPRLRASTTTATTTTTHNNHNSSSSKSIQEERKSQPQPQPSTAQRGLLTSAGKRPVPPSLTQPSQGPPPPTAQPSSSSPASSSPRQPASVAASSTVPAPVPSTNTPPPPSAPSALPSAAPESAAATTDDTTVHVTSTPIPNEGPPWSMRVEEVRSAKGELRYYRFILAVSFAALITTHTGVLHSMQTRNAAAALVLTCPPSGVHYRFLLHHVDVLRSVLNRTTEFAIRTVQRFFGLLFSPTQKPKGSQQQVLRGISSRLEAHPEACETYRSVKAELTNALALLCPLPLLAPATSGWVVPVLIQSSLVSARVRGNANASGTTTTGHRGRSSGNAAKSWLGVASSAAAAVTSTSKAATPAAAPSLPPQLSDILYDATAYVCEFSEGFASAFVCGLLSLATEDGGSQRRVRAPSTTLAGTNETTASATSAMHAGVSRAGSPTTATAATTTRDASLAYPSGAPFPKTTPAPEWLSPYAAYFQAVSAAGNNNGNIHNHGAGVIPTTAQIASEDAGVLETRREAAPGYVQLSKPIHATTQVVELCDSGSDADDACLRTRVSASTVSSMTPVLSPLTIDVEARSHHYRDGNSSGGGVGASGGHGHGVAGSPSARLPRGRTLHTLSPATGAMNLNLNSTTTHVSGHSSNTNNNNGSSSSNIGTTNGGTAGVAMTNASLAAPPTPTTAQLFTISADTSATSHAATVAMNSSANGGGGGGLGYANAAHNSSGDGVSASNWSRQQTSNAVSAMTSVLSAPSLPSTQAQQQPQPQPQTRQRPASTVSAAPPAPPPPPTSAPTVSQSKEDEFALHRGRLGRVVIFTQDATLARRLLLVSAFLWNDRSGAAERSVARRLAAAGPHLPPPPPLSPSLPSAQVGGSCWNAFHCEDAQRMYETAIAAAVPSADFANVPIQWVPEEFSEARLSALCSRFSPENTLLVVVPRQLQCRRVRLRKHVAGTTVLVEQQAGKEARIRSPAFPFRCRITQQTVLMPDPTVTTLLREARSLHEASNGTVDFADVFQRMVEWMYWQSAAAVLKKRDGHVHAHAAAVQSAHAASPPSWAAGAAANNTNGAALVAGDGSGGGGDAGGMNPLGEQNSGGLSRYASVDLLWPSRSVSAMASRTTTPTSRTPALFVPASVLHRTRTASSSVSASPCSPAMALDRSWVVDSAEEVLLPGSRGGASAAWAYTATNTNNNHNTISTTASSHHPNTMNATGVNGLCPAVAAANDAGTSAAAQQLTSTLLISHGLLQPPSAFVTASPTVPSTPQKSSSLRFLSWFKSSPTSATGPQKHHHPILSPTTLSQLGAEDGGQLPRLLIEDDDMAH